jgi:MFS superfamily sulfate permease-like transporter
MPDETIRLVCWDRGAGVILSIVLICAVLASLAVGVLVAYWVCMAMFGVFRMHVRQVAENSARRVVASTQVAEG